MKYRRRALGLLILLFAITYLDRVCIAVAGPRMQADLRIDPVGWGWVTGMFTLSYCLFEIPTGALGDRIGPRRVLTRIVLWWFAFTSLTGTMSNYYLLLLTRFCFGAGEAGGYPNAGVKGKFFINFSPAVSDKAVKAIRAEIRSWNLHLRSDKSIEDLSRMFNPIIRGWLQYYGRFYRSALYPPMRQLDRSLARWAYQKYKKLRGHLRRATHWIARLSRRDPKLWAHWQLGVRRGSMVGAV